MCKSDNSEHRRHSQTKTWCSILSVNTSRPNKSAPFKKFPMKRKTREGTVVSLHPLSQRTIESDTELRCPRRKVRKILLLGIRRVWMPGFCCCGVKEKNKRRCTSYSRKKKSLQLRVKTLHYPNPRFDLIYTHNRICDILVILEEAKPTIDYNKKSIYRRRFN